MKNIKKFGWTGAITTIKFIEGVWLATTTEPGTGVLIAGFSHIELGDAVAGLDDMLGTIG